MLLLRAVGRAMLGAGGIGGRGLRLRRGRRNLLIRFERAQTEPDRHGEGEAEDEEKRRKERAFSQLTTPGTASVNGAITASNRSPLMVRIV